MKTIPATYKGDRTVELAENLDLPKNAAVIVLIPEEEDETELRSQLQGTAERAFSKLWDNEGDEVWNIFEQDDSPIKSASVFPPTEGIEGNTSWTPL